MRRLEIDFDSLARRRAWDKQPVSLRQQVVERPDDDSLPVGHLGIALLLGTLLWAAIFGACYLLIPS